MNRWLIGKVPDIGNHPGQKEERALEDGRHDHSKASMPWCSATPIPHSTTGIVRLYSQWRI